MKEMGKRQRRRGVDRGQNERELAHAACCEDIKESEGQ